MHVLIFLSSEIRLCNQKFTSSSGRGAILGLNNSDWQGKGNAWQPGVYVAADNLKLQSW